MDSRANRRAVRRSFAQAGSTRRSIRSRPVCFLLMSLCLIVAGAFGQAGEPAASDVATDSPMKQLLARIQFVGNESYESSLIRTAFADNATFKFLVRQKTPDAELAERMATEIAKTYQLQGFLDATANANRLEHGAFEIRISEGPKYVRGSVIVKCDNEAVADDIRKMVSLEKSDFRTPVIGADGKIPKKFLGFWEPGSRCDDLSGVVPHTKRMVGERLDELGFLFPEYSITMINDAAASVVNLIVDITSLHEQLPISELQFTGLLRNSEERLREALNLQQPLRYSGVLKRQIVDTLESTGRFQRIDVTADVPFEAGFSVPLTIQVTENEHKPPFTEPLTDEQQAVMRFRHWLTHWEESGEDLVIRMTHYPDPLSDADSPLALSSVYHRLAYGSEAPLQNTIEAIVSPENGGVLTLQSIAHDRTVLAKRSAILTSELSGVLFDGSNRGYRLENVSTGVTLLLSTKVKQIETGISEGYSASTSSEQGRKPLVALGFCIPAPDLLIILSDVEQIGDDGRLLRARFNFQGAIADFERETGRLSELTFSDEDYLVSLTPRRGAFDEARALASTEMQRLPASNFDNFLSDVGIVAALQLAEELQASTERNRELGGVIRKALEGAAFEQLMADLSASNSQPQFPLPSSGNKAPATASGNGVWASAMFALSEADGMFKQGQKAWPQDSDIPTDEQMVDVLESFVAETELFDAFSRYAISFVRSLEDAEARRLSEVIESGELMGMGKGTPAVFCLNIIRNHPEADCRVVRRDLLRLLWMTSLRDRSLVRIVDGPDGRSLQWQLKTAQPPILPAALESMILPNPAESSGSPSNPSMSGQIGIETPVFKSFFGAKMP